MYKYVNDRTLIEICKQHSISIIHESADRVSQWCDDDQIKLKLSYICFYKDKSRCNAIPYIKVNETDIERVKQAKVLHVVLSDELSW